MIIVAVLFSLLSENTASLTKGSFAFSEDVSTLDLFISLESGDSGEHQEIIFVEENSIVATSAPYFIEGQVLGSKTERRSIISYKVERGDTLTSVAKKFQISENTIRWANSITGSSLSVGDELLILPTTGVLYYVQRGDTMSEIARRHKADSGDIISFNNIKDETQIRPGDQLIIPGGERAAVTAPQRPIIYSTGFVSVTHGTVTQTSHARHSNAVDIANACGTPIYAASSGIVTKTGSDPRLAGNFVWIDHGNLNALYAHMRNIHVSPGQRVSAGQQIGTMGNTGYTIGATGCHLHFETRGGSNPFSYMQRGQSMR